MPVASGVTPAPLTVRQLVHHVHGYAIASDNAEQPGRFLKFIEGSPLFNFSTRHN